jgi:hypothetical protein
MTKTYHGDGDAENDKDDQARQLEHISEDDEPEYWENIDEYLDDAEDFIKGVLRNMEHVMGDEQRDISSALCLQRSVKRQSRCLVKVLFS